MTIDEPGFTPSMLTKPNPTGLFDVETSLNHFALITYLVEPAHLRPHIDPRFNLTTITLPTGETKALVSVVPFLDVDFRFVRFPWLTWQFGQTNYRAYVIDSHTGEHAVWFFGTVLASYANLVPRYAWKLPWHKAKIDFDCWYDAKAKRYTRYQMKARSQWAEAELALRDLGKGPQSLVGFPALTAGLVTLTHPLKGYYYRRDGRLGSYSIWHDRLHLTVGEVITARFPLLERLGLVALGDTSAVHSVLIQPSTDFTIYLPPKAVSNAANF